MYLIQRFSAVNFQFTRCAVYLLLRLGNASLSTVLQISFLRKFPHSYRPMYLWIPATPRFWEITLILLFAKASFAWVAVELQLGYLEDEEGACSLSKMHFCPDLKSYIKTVSLMPYVLVGFNRHQACAGSLQVIKLPSSEIRCIFPPVNVVSLEQTWPTIFSFGFVVCFCLKCITVYILTL